MRDTVRLKVQLERLLSVMEVHFISMKNVVTNHIWIVYIFYSELYLKTPQAYGLYGL